MGGKRTTVLLAGLVLTAAAVGTTRAHAAPAATAEDGADTYNVAPGTPVHASNSGNVVFSASTALGTVTVTCTSSSWSSATGKTLKLNISDPQFAGSGSGGGCTDNFSGSDQLATSGTWTVVEKDFTNSGAGDEGLPEPNAKGDKMVMTVPQNGIVVTSSAFAGCTVTAAPTGAAKLTGAYDDAGNWALKGTLPVQLSSSCPGGAQSSTATITWKQVLTPALYDQG